LLIFEFDDERTGLFDGNRLNGHVRPQPAPHDGRDVARRRARRAAPGRPGACGGKPHQGTETEHPYDDGTGRGAFGGASTALQAHVLAHLRQGTPLENGAARLPGQPARAGSRLPLAHQRPTRVPMARLRPPPQP
jgi:hypothetical protein